MMDDVPFPFCWHTSNARLMNNAISRVRNTIKTNRPHQIEWYVPFLFFFFHPPQKWKMFYANCTIFPASLLFCFVFLFFYYTRSSSFHRCGRDNWGTNWQAVRSRHQRRLPSVISALHLNKERRWWLKGPLVGNWWLPILEFPSDGCNLSGRGCNGRLS